MSIVKDKDKKIYNIIQSELDRQNGYLELIASENFTSKAVLETAGSVLTKNVGKKSLVLTRSAQVEIKNYKRK